MGLLYILLGLQRMEVPDHSLQDHSSSFYLQPATLRDEEMSPPQTKIQACLQIAIKWEVPHFLYHNAAH